MLMGKSICPQLRSKPLKFCFASQSLIFRKFKEQVKMALTKS